MSTLDYIQNKLEILKTIINTLPEDLNEKKSLNSHCDDILKIVETGRKEVPIMRMTW